MVDRRKFLVTLGGGIVSTNFSGCLSSGKADSDTAPSSTGTPTASPSTTPTETPTATDRELNTPAEITDLELENQTETTHTLSLTVAPDNGEQVTDTWSIEGTSTVRVNTYEPLDSAATLTATVDGYEPATYEWAGDEPGKMLGVLITPESLEFEEVIR